MSGWLKWNGIYEKQSKNVRIWYCIRILFYFLGRVGLWSSGKPTLCCQVQNLLMSLIRQQKRLLLPYSVWRNLSALISCLPVGIVTGAPGWVSRRAWNSWSWGSEFGPHVGCREYLNIQKTATRGCHNAAGTSERSHNLHLK